MNRAAFVRRALAAAAALLTLAPVASAAPCGQPDIDVTFPPNDALAVPQNAVLSAHYAAPVDYAGEAATLSDPDGTELAVDTSYDTAEAMLRVTPRAPLAAGPYQIAWPALRGLATGRGLGATTSFTAGDTLDGAPPHFAGASSVTWDLSRDDDPCSGDAQDRFTYDLTLGPITDDQSASLLAVVVFETQSPTHAATLAPSELAVLPLAADGHARIARASTHGGKVCFAAVVRDLAFNVSGGGEQQACDQTTAPPFFAGCAVSDQPVPRSGFGYLLTALFSVCCQQVRRRRRSRRASPAAQRSHFAAFSVLACAPANPLHQPPPASRPLPAASPFVCASGICTQRYPRLPDDAEWRCAALQGVTLCAGGEPAAGRAENSASNSAPADSNNPNGYRCGTRRGERAERVCVDPAPDYPPGDATAYRCHFDASHGLTRVCQAQFAVPQTFAPLRPGAPECWLDADCEFGCDRGYCRGSAR